MDRDERHRWILFIDDRPENIAGAKDAGLAAIRFSGADALRLELDNLGIMKEAAD